MVHGSRLMAGGSALAIGMIILIIRHIRMIILIILGLGESRPIPVLTEAFSNFPVPAVSEEMYWSSSHVNTAKAPTSLRETKN